MYYYLVTCDDVFSIMRFDNEEEAVKAFEESEVKRILIYGEALREET